MLRRSTPRRQFLSYRTPSGPPRHAGDPDHPRIANAQQQIQVSSAYVVELQGARDELARAKRKARHAGGVVPGEPLTYEAWARGFLARWAPPRARRT